MAEIVGTPGDDSLRGTRGDDTIFAREGDDFVRGLSGDDELDGSFGQDTLRGGDGQDTLYGLNGDDLLIGGDDADVYVFEWNFFQRNFGNDTVRGFQDRVDVLDFSRTGATSDQFNFERVSGGTIITIDGEEGSVFVKHGASVRVDNADVISADEVPPPQDTSSAWLL